MSYGWWTLGKSVGFIYNQPFKSKSRPQAKEISPPISVCKNWVWVGVGRGRNYITDLLLMLRREYASQLWSWGCVSWGHVFFHLLPRATNDHRWAQRWLSLSCDLSEPILSGWKKMPYEINGLSNFEASSRKWERDNDWHSPISVWFEKKGESSSPFRIPCHKLRYMSKSLGTFETLMLESYPQSLL